MGCAGSRGNLADEERKIVIAEHDIGFLANSSEKVDLIIRKHANGFNLNLPHMKAVVKSLSLKFPRENKQSSEEDKKDKKDKPQHDHLKNFYKAFEVSDGYHFRDFLLAGLLMGNGPADLKATLIWDAFDTNADGKLTRANYLELFRTLVDISLDRTPNACSLNEDEQKKVSSYLDKLRAVKAKFLTEILNDSVKNAELISKKVFRKYAQKPENSDLLTPSGIRRAIEKLLSPPQNVAALAKEAPATTHAPAKTTQVPASTAAHVQTSDHKEHAPASTAAHVQTSEHKEHAPKA